MASATTSATLLSPTTHDSWLRRLLPPPSASCFTTSSSSSNPGSSPFLHLRRWTSRKPRRWSGHRGAASAGPPPPTPEPPFGKAPDSLAGLQVIFSRVQDRVRIFFAVLFWMSLFFWGSAWDGRDNGRNSKGPRFRK